MILRRKISIGYGDLCPTSCTSLSTSGVALGIIQPIENPGELKLVAGRHITPSRASNVLLVITGVVLVLAAVLLGWSAIIAEALNSQVPRIPLVAGSVGVGLLFVASAMCMKFVQPRWMLFWIVLVGAAARLVLIPAPPVRQTDCLRYLWDGLVWTHGYNPWAQSPAAALSNKAAGLPAGLHTLAIRHRALISHINHRKLPTIYPPVSEAVFAIAAFMAPSSTIMLKWWLVLFDAGTAVAIGLTLRHLRLPSGWLLLYWWNPMVINSFANEAHLDSIALFFVALFFLLLVSDCAIWACVALGLAIGAKFWPLVFISIVIRKYWKYPKRLAATLVALILSTCIALSPMLLTGPRAFISVQAYAHYWEANDLVFHLISHVWSGLMTSWFAAQRASRMTVMVLYALAVCGLMWRRPKDEIDLIKLGLWLTALIFLLSPTELPWYYTWLTPMLALSPRLSILLWSCTLGLYHLSYIYPGLIWVEHAPIILLFILEAFIPTLRWFPPVAPAVPATNPKLPGAL